MSCIAICREPSAHIGFTSDLIGVEAEKLRRLDRPLHGLQDRRSGIQSSHPRHHAIDDVRADQIGLGQHHAIGHRDLPRALERVVELVEAVPCIDRGDDAV